jgi:hypothetical protein
MSATAVAEPDAQQQAAAPVAPQTPPRGAAAYYGQRNRHGVGKPGRYSKPKEKLFFQSVRPERPTLKMAPGPVRKPGPIQMTINAYNSIDTAEKKVKEQAKKYGQKARIRTVQPTATIVPPAPGTKVYVSGGMKVTPGRLGVPRKMWDSKTGKFARRTGTTTLQTLLSSVYTMVAWALELTKKYLKEGWYDFAFKTLFLKEFLGGIFYALPKRIIMGPDRETWEEKAAKKELKLREVNNPIFAKAADITIERMNAKMTPEQRAPYERTRLELHAEKYGIQEAAPDVPRHAVVETTADREARMQNAAGAGAGTAFTGNVALLDRDDRRNRRGRRGGRGSNFGL